MTAIRTSVKTPAQVRHIFLRVLFFHDSLHCRSMSVFFSGDLADIFPGHELLLDAGLLWERN
jgi:hypothetical protein